MKPVFFAQLCRERRAFACFFLWLLLSGTAQAAATVVPQVPHSSFASLLQVLFGLGLVLAAIAGTAWLLKRISPGQVAASGSLRVVGGVAVGPKERVILVDVGDTRLVLGVTPAQISTLHQMPRPVEEVPESEAPALSGAFYQRLKDVLSKRSNV